MNEFGKSSCHRVLYSTLCFHTASNKALETKLITVLNVKLYPVVSHIKSVMVGVAHSMQDKTFGLKNKKGKRQQQIIKQVTNQVKFGGQSIQKVTVEYIPNYITFNLSDFLIVVVSV